MCIERMCCHNVSAKFSSQNFIPLTMHGVLEDQLKLMTTKQGHKPPAAKDSLVDIVRIFSARTILFPSNKLPANYCSQWEKVATTHLKPMLSLNWIFFHQYAIPELS
ncbi:uncharacterized protein LOC119635803 [Glossina fuscipes]|uniref:Uncharacterized protein LOC119635803 n=1 Tax=Glossina fuscipes TaxID=7396 RepID=A0A8U0WLB4_9MUSC|nr:uncharacterized protein LOC119635803 [Glossina fuscipes]